MSVFFFEADFRGWFRAFQEMPIMLVEAAIRKTKPGVTPKSCPMVGACACRGSLAVGDAGIDLQVRRPTRDAVTLGLCPAVTRWRREDAYRSLAHGTDPGTPLPPIKPSGLVSFGRAVRRVPGDCVAAHGVSGPDGSLLPAWPDRTISRASSTPGVRHEGVSMLEEIPAPVTQDPDDASF